LQTGKSLEVILETIVSDELGSDEIISSVAIVSKSGLLIAGQPPSVSLRETFSAMTAIMFSAAESTGKDIVRQKLERLIIHYERSIMVVTELSPTLCIVITSDRKIDESLISEKTDRIVSRIRSELDWLK